MFRLLRNNYGRDRKKKSCKVSAAGAKDIVETKESASDLHPFMAWLDPYMEARKTIKLMSSL